MINFKCCYHLYKIKTTIVWFDELYFNYKVNGKIFDTEKQAILFAEEIEGIKK